MEKIFSTRLDGKLIHQTNVIAAKKAISKKRLVEEGLNLYFEGTGDKVGHDILEASFGAWERDEAPQETLERA